MELKLDHEVSQEEVEHIDEQLQVFVEGHAGPRNQQGFNIVLRGADGSVRGGILGDSIWDWLQIGTLWVEEALRGQGHGRELLEAAEALGVERGCRYARLSTFDFEAKEFYEANGYSVYGRCDDIPQGHTQFHLSKKL